MIAKGTDPNAENGRGISGLLLASENGHVDCSKLLIENKADLNKVDMDGSSALILASKNGHLGIKLVLLEYGAETDETMDSRMTELIQNRINEIYLIRNIISTTIFPDDDPVVANIISQYATGTSLENLINYRDGKVIFI